MRGNDGLSPGDIGDPVADSIRAQQNRDAMPTDEEIAEAKREANTCDRCGEHDPDSVKTRFAECYTPDCRSIQRAPEPMGNICDDCFDPSSKLDTIKWQLSQDNVDYVIEYECGILKTENDEYDGEGRRPRYWQPSIQIKNPRCGHRLRTVWTDDVLDSEADQ